MATKNTKYLGALGALKAAIAARKFFACSQKHFGVFRGQNAFGFGPVLPSCPFVSFVVTFL
jgi:hypothetical protein